MKNLMGRLWHAFARLFRLRDARRHAYDEPDRFADHLVVMLKYVRRWQDSAHLGGFDGIRHLYHCGAAKLTQSQFDRLCEGFANVKPGAHPNWLREIIEDHEVYPFLQWVRKHENVLFSDTAIRWTSGGETAVLIGLYKGMLVPLPKWRAYLGLY